MAQDAVKRQKKLMKKRQKDKARKQNKESTTPFRLLSDREKVLLARNFPIHECLINPSWQEGGLVTILLSRRQPDDNLIFAVYLVDIFCLGLKNTFCNADYSLLDYKRELISKVYNTETPVSCPPPLAHHLIYGSIEYAKQLGFKPNKDFKMSQYVLEELDNIEPCEGIEFGKDGKPLYISGPDDNADQILMQLEAKVGRGNFDFIYGNNDSVLAAQD